MSGYANVSFDQFNNSKPYQAKVSRGGEQVYLGTFATAEEAALCFARSPEGRARAPPPGAMGRGEQALQQARAEGLTLRKAANHTGYANVSKPAGERERNISGGFEPYQAWARRSGESVHLGDFATAEEAALCVARSHAEQAKPPRAAQEAAPLTREEVLQQALAEKLPLLKADNKSGYRGVECRLGRSKHKPYRAQVSRGGKTVNLGSFATAEEAALCIARTPEGRAAAEKAAAAPMTREQALQQARAEGLALQKSYSQQKSYSESGYRCVYVQSASSASKGSKPYAVQVTRSGKTVQLGSFATVEEAALCFARSPEGRATAPPPGAMRRREQALQQARAEGLTLRKAASHTGYANVTMRAGGQEIRMSGGSEPYQAWARRSGESVHLGDFATAEEAALCVARSQAAAEQVKPPRAAREAQGAAPLTREEALQQAQAEGLQLQKADNTSGYANVGVHSGNPKPYKVVVSRGGARVTLGSFATAEEAALCLARSQAAAKEAKEAKEEAEEAAEAQEAEEAAEAQEAEEAEEEEAAAQRRKPGCFATAEEVVRCAARSPAGGQARASLTRSSEGDTVEGEGMHKAATKPAVKEEMVPDAIVKEEGVPAPLMPSEPRWPDTVVKQEDEVVIDHEEHSDAQPAKKRKSPGQGMHGEHARRKHARGQLPLQKKPYGRPPHGTDGLPMRWDGPKEAGRWV
eukprot:scaffold39118_cov52-Phaeocystis_antarctica.AAC.3